MAIDGFKHRGLRELYQNGTTRRIGTRVHTTLVELMDIIDYATDLTDLSGIRGFHRLRGDRRGVYAFIVTRNWRLTFSFRDGGATDLDYEDYH